MSLWRNFLRWAGTKMIIAANNYHKLSDHNYLETCITRWLSSPERRMQIDGERYYEGHHDILKKRRTTLGEDGELVEIKYLPNNKIIDNQYGKMGDQKVNYLLGQPITFSSDNDQYVEQLQTVFNKRFNRTIKRVGLGAINSGIAWLYVYIENNKLQFKMFPAHEVLPFWTDTAHTDVHMVIRSYLEEKPNASDPSDVTRKVEIYKSDGIEYYIFDNNRLEPDVTKPKQPHMKVKTGDVEEGRNWERIPLIPFKFNAKEIGMLTRCKSLQDGINFIMSKYEDDMTEDARSTILVLENFGGENLAEFRQRLAQYNAIKVEGYDGSRGDVRTLQIEVNAANYESILKVLKSALIDNCRGFDFTELKSGSPNQMNIKSILSDIDMDANDMETEFQASFEDLLWFVNNFLGVTEEQTVDIVFNRDTIVNETEIIASMVSMGVEVSNETKLKQLPFIDDPEAEQKRVDKEREKAMDAYNEAMPGMGAPVPGQKPAQKKQGDVKNANK